MNRRTAVILLLVAAGVVALLTAFAFTDPFHPAGSFLPRCLFREATGYLCPGCGSGRATHSLLHGRLALAWRCNPLFVILLPVLLVGMANEVVRAVRGRPLWRRRVPGKVLLAVGILVLVFGVIRNMPWPMFDGLRPPVSAESGEGER